MQRKLIALFFMALIISTMAGMALAESPDPEPQYAKGIILSMEYVQDSGLEDSLGFGAEAYNVHVQIISGPFQGQVAETKHFITGTPAYDIHISIGDRVLLAIETVDGQVSEVYVADNERDRSLMWFALLFVLVLSGFGGIKGLKSVLSLVVTGVMIIWFFIPMLLSGHNPILLAVIVSAVATAFTITMVGGLSGKSAAAIIGTVGGVLTAGLLAVAFGGMARLTGLSTQEAQMLVYIPQAIDFDFRGLLLAGIIIGALGAVMDVGMSIASSVSEVQKADPGASVKRLFWAGMNVGRDIMGTMANTLILAYTGSSLSLLLLVRAYDIDMIRLMNMDSISSEVIRALAGSMGL
ncbi:MAG TPA: YibE/F family protein, partial [Bacillota bacterium]|nr:YibE/F family protein [Bacillota bacterium]